MDRPVPRLGVRVLPRTLVLVLARTLILVRVLARTRLAPGVCVQARTLAAGRTAQQEMP